jgi:hypothetical protein
LDGLAAVVRIRAIFIRGSQQPFVSSDELRREEYEPISPVYALPKEQPAREVSNQRADFVGVAHRPPPPQAIAASGFAGLRGVGGESWAT